MLRNGVDGLDREDATHFLGDKAHAWWQGEERQHQRQTRSAGPEVLGARAKPRFRGF